MMLEAGRKLDAKVAALVFGMHEHAECDQEMGDDPDWLCYGTDTEGYSYCREYSTDIADAWTVVEHLRTQGFYVEIRMGIGLGLENPGLFARIHEVEVLHRERAGASIQGESVPHIICKAALAVSENPTTAR